MKGHGHVPIKLYLNKEDWVGFSMGHSLQTVTPGDILILKLVFNNYVLLMNTFAYSLM